MNTSTRTREGMQASIGAFFDNLEAGRRTVVPGLELGLRQRRGRHDRRDLVGVP